MLQKPLKNTNISLPLIEALKKEKGIFIKMPAATIIKKREDSEKEKIRYAILIQIQSELLAIKRELYLKFSIL